MKIEKSISPLPPSSVNETTGRNTPPKSSDTAATAPQGVNVSLGSASNQLRSMEVNVSNTPAVDSKKVAEIKQAISEGRFQINSAAIADGLISDVEELINASQS
jgi:negative regulator of flagellin synthesis FlgM